MTPHHPSVTGLGAVTGHVSVAGHRSVTAHRDRIAGLLAPVADLPLHRVPLSAGLGAALGEDLVAPVSLPPFDNSQMDGFAVRRRTSAATSTGARGRSPLRTRSPPEPCPPLWRRGTPPRS